MNENSKAKMKMGYFNKIKINEDVNYKLNDNNNSQQQKSNDNSHNKRKKRIR